MGHVVLLGDSIFDNERYVPGGPDVVGQVRKELPGGWTATLLAVDGAVTLDVASQLRKLPADADCLVVSVGGNDALGYSGLVRDADRPAGEVLMDLADARDEFRRDYQAMLVNVLAAGKPVMVCTIYDSIPDMGRVEAMGLAIFNDVIVRIASEAGVAVLDLRQICDQRTDYSPMSPIEPSRSGGAKIAAAIARITSGTEFGTAGTVVHGRSVLGTW